MRTHRQERVEEAVRAAFLYFHRSLTQKEIARRMGVSAMTVSRLLDWAREHDLVRVQVRLPVSTDEGLGERLAGAYPVRKAYVVPWEGADEGLTPFLGRIGAFFLDLHLGNEMVLGLGTGRTMAQVIHHVPERRLKNLVVVQLMGGLGDLSSVNPTSIIYEFCSKTGGSGRLFSAPVRVRDAQIRDRLMRELLEDGALGQAMRSCQVACVSVGVTGEASLYVRSHVVELEEMRRLEAAGAAGDLLGRFFDSQGRYLDEEADLHLTSIPHDWFRAIPTVIAVAGGAGKVPAIRGALLTGDVDVFVTDDVMAEALLQAGRLPTAKGVTSGTVRAVPSS